MRVCRLLQDCLGIETKRKGKRRVVLIIIYGKLLMLPESWCQGFSSSPEELKMGRGKGALSYGLSAAKVIRAKIPSWKCQ